MAGQENRPIDIYAFSFIETAGVAMKRVYSSFPNQESQGKRGHQRRYESSWHRRLKNGLLKHFRQNVSIDSGNLPRALIPRPREGLNSDLDFDENLLTGVNGGIKGCSLTGLSLSKRTNERKET